MSRVFILIEWVIFGMSKHNELTGSSGTKIDWELKIGHGWQIVTNC